MKRHLDGKWVFFQDPRVYVDEFNSTCHDWSGVLAAARYRELRPTEPVLEATLGVLRLEATGELRLQ